MADKRVRISPYLCEKLKRLRTELHLLNLLTEQKITEYNEVIQELWKRYKLKPSTKLNLDTYEVVGGEEYGNTEGT